MSWTGTLSRADFGPGAWILETSRGERFTLYGDVPTSLQGRRVRVEGEQVEAMGFAMATGEAIQVAKIQLA